MASKFFGSLTIVVGVFICFAGACFTLFGAGVQALFGLVVGIALIVVGVKMLRGGGEPPPGPE
jgi:hypothetical protein